MYFFQWCCCSIFFVHLSHKMKFWNECVIHVLTRYVQIKVISSPVYFGWSWNYYPPTRTFSCESAAIYRTTKEKLSFDHSSNKARNQLWKLHLNCYKWGEKMRSKIIQTYECVSRKTCNSNSNIGCNIQISQNRNEKKKSYKNCVWKISYRQRPNRRSDFSLDPYWFGTGL